jgi:hypothetical protein
MASVPVAYLPGLLSYGRLPAVSVISGTASIAFTAASGAYLKHLVRSDHLLVANGLGILRIRGGDVAAPRDPATRSRGADLLAGWRFILHDRALRRLFLNPFLVSGLILATVPLLAVLPPREYHFPAWQYGLAFGVPALGGWHMECERRTPPRRPHGDLGHPRHTHRPPRRDHDLRSPPARHPALAARSHRPAVGSHHAP